MSAIQQILVASKGASDPYYTNVSLLLHMDGANGSTSFPDNSPSPKTVLRYGNPQVSTAEWRFGGASVFYSDGGEYLMVEGSPDFNFGTGAFTVECWIYQVNDNRPDYFTFATQKWSVGQTASSDIAFWDGSTYRITGGAVALNVWHHIALTRQGTQVKLFMDGVQQSSTWTDSGPTNLGQAVFFDIGFYPGSTAFRGYIDDFRVTKGVARYTSNFTPPTEPFPNY